MISSTRRSAILFFEEGGSVIRIHSPCFLCQTSIEKQLQQALHWPRLGRAMPATRMFSITLSSGKIRPLGT
jgi:hypothetical protein